MPSKELQTAIHITTVKLSSDDVTYPFTTTTRHEFLYRSTVLKINHSNCEIGGVPNTQFPMHTVVTIPGLPSTVHSIDTNLPINLQMTNLSPHTTLVTKF